MLFLMGGAVAFVTYFMFITVGPIEPEVPVQITWQGKQPYQAKDPHPKGG